MHRTVQLIVCVQGDGCHHSGPSVCAVSRYGHEGGRRKPIMERERIGECDAADGWVRQSDCGLAAVVDRDSRNLSSSLLEVFPARMPATWSDAARPIDGARASSRDCSLVRLVAVDAQVFAVTDTDVMVAPIGRRSGER